MIHRFLPAALAAAVLPCVPAAQQRTITVGDLARISQVVAVDVTEDGSACVYAVREMTGDPTERGGDSGYRTHLYWVSLEEPGATPIALTHGERGGTGPALSPDGKTLAFSRRGEEGGAQVWLLPLDRPGEARQLTTLEHGAFSPIWRPDGEALLVTSSIPESALDGEPPWGTGQPGLAPPAADSEVEADADGSRDALRAWLADGADDQEPYVITRLNFQGEFGLAGEPSYRHLFVVDADGADEPVQLTDGFTQHASARWAPSGRAILFGDGPRTGEHPETERHRGLWAMSADGGEPRALLMDPPWSYGGASVSRDGQTIWYVASRTDEPTFAQDLVSAYDITSGTRRTLTQQLDSNASRVTEASDGRLLFLSNIHGATPLLALEPDSGDVDAYFTGPGAVTSFDEGAGRVVYAATTPANPSELYVVERDGTTRRLTDLHASWLEGVEVVLPRQRWIEREDGTRVQSWVMEPTARAEGRRYPTILHLHGGPHVMWGPGSFSMWHEWQLCCAWGYGVVYSNPRGSSGYGYAHQKGNFQDWGVGPGGDVLAALDAAVEDHDWIDPERLLVTGGSYAGYLTAWVLAHDDRFRAGVAQRGVYDLATFFGEGNAWRLVEWSFGGLPWDPEVRAMLDEQSPFTHAASIETPFLVMHGSNDLRTGVSQSEMLYRALKTLGRDVEYVRYPGAGHDLSRTGDPEQRVDRLLRIVEFFERWIENDRESPGAR